MYGEKRPFGQEQRTGPEPIASEKVESPEERKTFFLDMLENQRGRCLRLTERAGKRQMVIIPADRLREIGELLIQMADWSDKNP